MVEGIRWAYAESKSKFAAAAEIKKNWEHQVRAELGAPNAGTIANAAGFERSIDTPHVPQGDWTGTGGS